MVAVARLPFNALAWLLFLAMAVLRPDAVAELNLTAVALLRSDAVAELKLSAVALLRSDAPAELKLVAVAELLPVAWAMLVSSARAVLPSDAEAELRLVAVALLLPVALAALRWRAVALLPSDAVAELRSSATAVLRFWATALLPRVATASEVASDWQVLVPRCTTVQPIALTQMSPAATAVEPENSVSGTASRAPRTAIRPLAGAEDARSRRRAHIGSSYCTWDMGRSFARMAVYAGVARRRESSRGVATSRSEARPMQN